MSIEIQNISKYYDKQLAVNDISFQVKTGEIVGSVSGGCVESAVVRECIGLIKDNKPCKKLEFKVSNESAWEVGLACGGEIAVYLEQVN